MAQPLPSVANPAAYAAALARNQAAISTVITYGSLQSGDVAANQTLPNSSTLFKNATLDQLKQSLSNIGNSSAYDSNRGQFEASSQQVVDKITQLSQPVPVIPAPVSESPPPQVNRDLTVTDVISTPTTPVIPSPVVETPPVQARGMTPISNVSTPSTISSSSLPKIAVIAVAVFGIGLLFLTPKASKRR